MGTTDKKSATRNNRTICLPFSQDNYNSNIYDPGNFRNYIDEQIELFSELFPPEIINGHQMKDINYSKKMAINIRRITINGIAYTIRPAFVMPYMTGFVSEIEKALFLRKFDLPYWALAHVFGRDSMNWFRMEHSLERNSIVGTTIRNPEDIPEHLAADKKHSRFLGDKTYVATTVGDGCVLGAAVAKDAGEKSLTVAYQVYKDESQCLKPDHTPVTTNMDGWKATRKAWKSLFPAVVIICCFLHVYIKIRDRAKKKYRDIFEGAVSKL